ncbi:hypothetical protein ACVO28_004556 [Escherichia coli]
MIVIFPARTIFYYSFYEHPSWDSEDKAYASVFKSISNFIFHQAPGLNINTDFHDDIKENAEIIDFQFDDCYILLDADKGTLFSQTDNFL